MNERLVITPLIMNQKRQTIKDTRHGRFELVY